MQFSLLPYLLFSITEENCAFLPIFEGEIQTVILVVYNSPLYENYFPQPFREISESRCHEIHLSWPFREIGKSQCYEIYFSRKVIFVVEINLKKMHFMSYFPPFMFLYPQQEQGYKGYKVTKVTVLVQIFKINSGFQGFRSYGGYGGLLLMIFLDILRVTRLQRLRCFFQSFKRSNQGYKVSEVTRVTEGFCCWFSLTSLELQGYEGYGPFFKFSKDQIARLPILLFLVLCNNKKLLCVFQR